MVSHDPAKASSTKGIHSPLQVSVQCPCLTTIEEDMDHQRREDPNLCLSAQVSNTPNIFVLNESITPWARPIRRVTSWLDPPILPRYYTTKVCEVFQDFNVLATRMDRLYCFIQYNSKHLDLNLGPKKPKVPRASLSRAVPLEPLPEPPVT